MMSGQYRLSFRTRRSMSALIHSLDDRFRNVTSGSTFIATTSGRSHASLGLTGSTNDATAAAASRRPGEMIDTRLFLGLLCYAVMNDGEVAKRFGRFTRVLSVM